MCWLPRGIHIESDMINILKTLRKVTSESKHLLEVELTMVHNVLSKYELILSQTLVTCKTKTLNIGLQKYAKPYDTKPYPVPRSHKVIFNK